MIFSKTDNMHRDRSRSHSYAVLRRGPPAQGFTLIEVVVALAIVAVSFMALYGGIMQMVNATTLMQEKTIASWIAYDQITELRLKNDLANAPKSSGIKEMAGVTWRYSVELRETGSDAIRQVIVSVAPDDEPERTLGLVSGVIFSTTPVSQIPAPGPGPGPGPGSDSPIVSGASPYGGPTR